MPQMLKLEILVSLVTDRPDKGQQYRHNRQVPCPAGKTQFVKTMFGIPILFRTIGLACIVMKSV